MTVPPSQPVLPSEMAPSQNGSNGRDSKGRFAPGNAGGPGNPRAVQREAWIKALTKAVTPEDIGKVVKVLVKAALAGEKWAIPELLNRTVGKPTEHVAVEGDQSYQIVIRHGDEPSNSRNGGNANPEPD